MVIIAGPCVVENLEATLKGMLDVFNQHGHPTEFYFKSSCVKDNRTRPANYRGNFEENLEHLLEIKKKFHVEVCTDFHSVEQIEKYGEGVDLIQIPAFLARQNSILEAAATVRKKIHIKKPQHMSPQDTVIPMRFLTKMNPSDIFITDRGTCFGYDKLIFDPRHIFIIKKFTNAKVLVDITHMNKNYSPFISPSYIYSFSLGASAIVSGADGLFMEVSSNSLKASCDADTQMPLGVFKKYYRFFKKLEEFYNAPL